MEPAPESRQAPDIAPQSSSPPLKPLPRSATEIVLAVCVIVLLVGFFFPWALLESTRIRPTYYAGLTKYSRAIYCLPILQVLLMWAIYNRKFVRLLAWLTGIATVLGVVAVTESLMYYTTSPLGWLILWLGCLLPVLAGEARNPSQRHPRAGRFLRRKSGLVSHWFVLLEDFNTSTGDFYAGIEAEVKQRRLPLPDMTRVFFDEGGALSAEREYLRFRHERLVIDLCAAPYGTDYFFSLRTCELPLGFGFMELVMTLITAFVAYKASVEVVGPLLGPAILVGVLLALVFGAFTGAFRKNVRNLDDALLRMPFFGAYYELLFRKNTYYRHDTRLMFLRAVEVIVKRHVNDAVAGKSAKLGKQFEFSPLLGGEVYDERPKELSLDLASPIQITTDGPIA